jgi:D-alanyl-D-alanine carboxypeptidase/D-alanyl-D-alanine-endopeptidase (penicillin-binding protein 4)
MALKQLLQARGVVVRGKARAEHWEAHDVGNFLQEVRQPVPSFESLLNRTSRVSCHDAGRPELRADETVLATHVSVPLVEDVVLMNKVSQNLHAEMLLRNLGKSTTCVGRISTGAQMVRQFLLAAGLDQDDFVFYDGSGLSGHDLVTPRATARLLQYAAEQTWFADWKQSLPVGGVDGSLEGRFTKAPLKGKVFAKTGTLGEARALSGYVECASGRTVIFSIMVGNHAPQNNADREVMDKIVAAIAAAN